MKNDYKKELLEYIKLDETVEFICHRCQKRKIAKKYAQYTYNDETVKLCNGCYGRLMSEK